MVLLSVTAVVVNKMQRSLSAHSPARGCVPSSASALSAVCVQGGPSVLLLLGSQLPGSFQGPPHPPPQLLHPQDTITEGVWRVEGFDCGRVCQGPRAEPSCPRGPSPGSSRVEGVKKEISSWG